jgi:hypothetical protein
VDSRQHGITYAAQVLFGLVAGELLAAGGAITQVLLYDDGASADLPAPDQIADLDFHHIAATQLAVDRQIEKRSISKTSMLIEEEPNLPDLTWLERPFCADPSPGVPRTMLPLNGVELCLSRCHTPSISLAEGRK